MITPCNIVRLQFEHDWKIVATPVLTMTREITVYVAAKLATVANHTWYHRHNRTVGSHKNKQCQWRNVSLCRCVSDMQAFILKCSDVVEYGIEEWIPHLSFSQGLEWILQRWPSFSCSADQEGGCGYIDKDSAVQVLLWHSWALSSDICTRMSSFWLPWP